MKTVFLCTPLKLAELNQQLIERIKRIGFKVLCAMTDSPSDVSPDEMFRTNVGLIRRADFFVAVLKDYGKDLAAEVGMAYAWNMPTIGIDFNANEADVMCYHALDRVIKPGDLEETLAPFLMTPIAACVVSAPRIRTPATAESQINHTTEANRLSEFARLVRQSTMKRLKQVARGDEEWRPRPGMLSFVDVLKHLVDADQWLLDYLHGTPKPRAVISPGDARASDWDLMLNRLVQLGREKAEFFGGLSDGQLHSRIVEPQVLGETTWWWMIVRANLDHEIHHRGALNLAIRLKYG
ncbi:MAG: DinB family protein [Planctomycetes bacterium]|nr:DinB family protein [Planctomycetota bacterium]